MENSNKITQEELLILNSLSDEYNRITSSLGQIEVERISVQEQLDKLFELKTILTEEYKLTREKELKFSVDIENKYGVVSIDVETGIFTPASERV
jgi:hypothetical protein